MKRILCAALAAMMLFLPACVGGNNPIDPTTTADPTTTEAPITAAPSETTAAPSTTEAPATTTAPETTAPPETEPVAVAPAYTNPLTGLPAEADLSTKRPAAVMLNNLRIACPQEGIARAEILYECPVEGGLTRLMGVFSDYASLGVIGSIRSSRDYYLDMAQDHDALYIHAGGSPQAYAQIAERGINNICFVNMYTLPANSWYRDQNRIIKMGTEHSLMSTGAGIQSAIAYKKYSTEHKEGYTSPFVFDAEKCSSAAGDEAKHLILKYSAYSIAQMIYSEKTNTYYRYQFGNVAHIDGTTGEQLNYTNILVLLQDVSVIPGDTSGRLQIGTTGTGKGYYISGGKSIAINWTKETRDSVISFTTESGEPLVMTPGKTFVSILPTNMESSLELNHK